MHPPQLSEREPVDPDVGLRRPRSTRHRRDEATLLATIAVGGALGALARFAAGRVWPRSGTAFPWTTLAVNLVGCALIGVLMVLVADLWTGRRLLRPFVGTGVLGGFTTFSTYAVDVQRLSTSGQLPTAVAYLVSTVVAALVAVWTAATGTRALLRRRTR